MQRCGSSFLLTLSIAFVIALTGCLGKSTGNQGNGGVQTVTLNPGGIISLDVGGTLFFSASGRDANGGTVLGLDIRFTVASGSPNAAAPLSVINNGAGSASSCAGQWDPTATICSPGTPGIALVTAVINGVSSPPTTVYVHQHIDSIQIQKIIPPGPPPQQYDCFSQGQTWLFAAVAFSNGVDITGSVGPVSWTSSNPGVTLAIPTVPPDQPNVLNQVQTTARDPGVTQLFATVSGTTSSPFPYTTCLIKAIYLQIGGQGQAGSSITVNNGGSVPITATAVDTLYGIAHNTPLTSPPLTWSTTNPEVAAFSSATNTTGNNAATARNNLGGATLFASCSPPSCNVGVLPGLPVYASDGLLPNGTPGFGTISVDVISTSAVPTYTAWAATKGCNDQSGCSSALFSVTPGTTPIHSIVSLPRTPNSMMFNHVTPARIYFGTDQGLMFVDVASPSANVVSNSPTPCKVSLCGKVLTISNDGKQVVISDTVSVPSQVYIFNSGTAGPIDLVIPGQTATAATFSPDQLKLFILTNTGNLYVYSTVDALAPVPIATTATDVKFSADGSFAYVAGARVPGNSISGLATCNSQPTHADAPSPPNSDFVTTPGIPLQIFPSPDAQHVVALDPPYMDTFTTSDSQHDLLDGQFTCNAPTVNFPAAAQFRDLGQGNFTPIYSQLVNDGAEVIVVARKISAVLVFNVNNGTTTSVPLVGNTDPLSASASTDGSQVYIAACDQYSQDGKTCVAGSVHIVNTVSQGDFQQVPYVNMNDNNNPNMCNGLGGSAPLCLPDLIAIAPQ